MAMLGDSAQADAQFSPLLAEANARRGCPLLWEERKKSARSEYFAFCEGFRMPAA